jgi:2-(1,2-epoxy-1,2-dihydrophenyl)acetyl-CoA isomerase
MSPSIATTVVDGVGHLELNRPAAANAIDLLTARAFGEAVYRFAASESVRAVVVSGAGSRFCVGGDVAAFAAAPDRSAYLQELADEFDGALQRLRAMDKVVVAAVQGAVAGAGMSVVLSCDLVVAASSTKLLTAYAGIGLTPDCGLSWLLPRAVGGPRAADLLLAGRVLSAREAQEWGLLTRVVDDGDELVAATTLARAAGRRAGSGAR